MKSFQYTIKDEVGIHARPAGLLSKKAQEFESRITVECNGKSAQAARLMSIMSLGAKKGTEITVKAEGTDEEQAAKELLSFFEQNL